MTGRINIDALIALDKLRSLRLEHHTGVQLVFLTYPSQGDTQFMDIVLIFCEPTQIIIQIAVHRVGQSGEIMIPSIILPIVIAKHIIGVLTEIECRTVALAVFVLELITELQESTSQNRFTIGCLQAISPVLARCEVITVGDIGGVASLEVVHHLIQVHIIR